MEAQSHGLERIARKLFLEHAAQWPRDSSLPFPGPRKRKNAVPDRIITLQPFNRKSFFTLLSVILQRAVGKTESTVLFDSVDDAASIHGPETEMTHHHSNGLADADWRGSRKQVNPPQLEHLPCAQATDRLTEGLQAASKLYLIPIDGITWRQCPIRRPDISIREACTPLT